MELDVNFAGLTFSVVVEHFFEQKPLGKWADSDMDAQGYTELDYDIVRVEDEAGNLVNTPCLSDLDWCKLDSLVLEKFKESQEDYDYETF